MPHLSKARLTIAMLGALAPGCRDSSESDEALAQSTGDVGTDSDGESRGEASDTVEADATVDSGSDGATEGPIEGPIEGRLCPPDSALTADSFGMPFMLTWCAGCHSAALPEGERAEAPLGVDLDTLQGTQALLLRVYARSADDNLTMPPAGGPSAEDRERLGDWLACGAPE